MKIVFISNYFNHHQASLCSELNKIDNTDFKFIETEPMEEERVKLGWSLVDIPDYVIRSYENEKAFKRSEELINIADFVIFGSAPYSMIKKRLKNKKTVFIYSERIFKGKFKLSDIYLSILMNIRWKRRKNVYLLCASGFAADDYNRIGLFKNRCIKWGYFPELKEFDNLDLLLSKKKKNSIFWAARFIDWKHPELPVLLAEKLIRDNYNFELHMVGSGALKDKIKRMIADKKLEKNIFIDDSLPTTEVRKKMEESEIFLITSDSNEGWGAVLNESMNSCCAVVASNLIGSSKYLIENGKNGLLFESENIDDLFDKVVLLLNNDNLRINISKNAYLTIKSKWNAYNASNCLVTFYNYILTHSNLNCFESGPCSKDIK